MSFIQKIVIRIKGEEFELEPSEVRKLYNELQELLHEKPHQFAPSCPQPRIQPIPMRPFPQPGYFPPTTYWDNS